MYFKKSIANTYMFYEVTKSLSKSTHFKIYVFAILFLKV
jgi:hypothetical protein